MEQTENTIKVIEEKGVVLTLPKADVVRDKNGNGEVVYQMLAKVNDMLVVFAVLDKTCGGAGTIGVLDENMTQLLAEVNFDVKEAKHKSPAFVAEYMCGLGQGKIKAPAPKRSKNEI